MQKKLFVLFSFVLVLAVALSAVAPAAAQTSERGNGRQVAASPNGVYIVQMIDDPVVAYKGGIRGLRPTKPAPGQKIDPNNPAVVAYVGYLDSKHNEALSRVGGQKIYDYRYSFNGFAAKMSLEQANKMAGINGVLAVTPDTISAIDTSSTPAFLGLSDPGGLWDQLGGVNSAGENIIIGILDTGIWPEHLSFSDREDQNGIPSDSPSSKKVYQQMPGWHGRCVPGEDFSATNCNQKLIGAQYFNAGWGPGEIFEDDFMSARDWDGHGTHTSSTAGGNNGVPATGPASVFGSISGMAPRARIAMYKVCWLTSGGVLCTGSDRVAATDQAVADGVDVINHSIGATLTNFLDPVQVAFLFAADAGVFVAASAGNSGPAASTVASPGPWVTTVAASTHNRNGVGSVTLGNGVTYTGASVANAVGPAPLIDSTAAGLSGADPAQLALCFGAADGAVVLDPAKVAGKIVVCDRGVTARINKSLAVQEAGGIGMILVNTSANTLNADFHFVPTVHLAHTDRAAVKAYAAAAGATATINQATIVYNEPAPFIAAFSSRGPSLATNGDILKPDLTAPGVDILAGYSPRSLGRLFDLLSGTSMASPHVAGLAALLKDLHPDWTPMMIKSALMTTGYDVLDSTTTASKIFRQGAGHVRPNSAADPGLVYSHGFNDWLAFLCGTGQLTASYCPSIRIDPSDLNVASIAIGDMTGIQTVTRKVTNVGSGAATYNASVSGMTGINVVVSPSSLTLNPGETKSFTVSFTTTTAALNTYVGGHLTWSDGTHNVRIPLVVKPVALSAPTQVSGNGGPINYNVTFGYNGPFTATARGLVEAAITADTVADDPTNSTCSLTSPNAKLIPVTIAAGTTYARFSLFDADVAPGSDIDLCVFTNPAAPATPVLVGSSGSSTSAEEVNLLNPAAGNYTVVVQGWGVPGSSPFKLHTWLLGSAAAGNMTVSAPATATVGGTGTINLTFSGLAPAKKYLGSVVYGGAAGMPDPTIVRVDTP